MTATIVRTVHLPEIDYLVPRILMKKNLVKTGIAAVIVMLLVNLEPLLQPTLTQRSSSPASLMSEAGAYQKPLRTLLPKAFKTYLVAEDQ